MSNITCKINPTLNKYNSIIRTLLLPLVQEEIHWLQARMILSRSLKVVIRCITRTVLHLWLRTTFKDQYLEIQLAEFKCLIKINMFLNKNSSNNNIGNLWGSCSLVLISKDKLKTFLVTSPTNNFKNRFRN